MFMDDATILFKRIGDVTLTTIDILRVSRWTVDQLCINFINKNG